MHATIEKEPNRHHNRSNRRRRDPWKKYLKNIKNQFMGKKLFLTIFPCIQWIPNIHGHHLMERKRWRLILKNFLHVCHQNPYAFKISMRKPQKNSIPWQRRECEPFLMNSRDKGMMTTLNHGSKHSLSNSTPPFFSISWLQIHLSSWSLITRHLMRYIFQIWIWIYLKSLCASGCIGNISTLEKRAKLFQVWYDT